MPSNPTNLRVPEQVPRELSCIGELHQCCWTLSSSKKFMNVSKMYICIKRSIPSHKVLGAAHGVLIAHLKFQDRPDYQDWLKNSFRKVVCEVSDNDFELLKQQSDYITVTESGLDNQEIALVFCPRVEWPKPFKYFSLLKV